MDYVPVKIRELPPGNSLSNAGAEIGAGNLAGAVSQTIPARLAAVIARTIVRSRVTVAPPIGPAEGDRYLIPGGALLAWADHIGQYAEWLLLPNGVGASTGGWYYTEASGVCYVKDEGILIALDGAGGVLGPFVTRAGAESLTNKTISAPGGVMDLPAPGAPNSAARLQDVTGNTQHYNPFAGGTPPGTVNLATTAALPACTYANGAAGVGATLTANANGALANQDGQAVTAGKLIVVWWQADKTQNGFYSVTNAGSGGAPWVLTRDVNADTAAELGYGTAVVLVGTLYGGYVLQINVAAAGLVIGTTLLPITVFGLSATFAAPLANVTAWTGKVSFWPDPFFRNLAVGALWPPNINGRPRFLPLGVFGTSVIATNILTPYNSPVYRVAHGNIPGVLGYPDEIYPEAAGAYTGLPFSAATSVIGTGDTGQIYCNFYNAAGALLGQVAGSAVVTSATPQLITVSTTFPATAVSVLVYFTDGGGSNMDVCALWGGDFDASTLPTAPPLHSMDYAEQGVRALANPLPIPLLLPPFIYFSTDLEASVYWDSLVPGRGASFNWRMPTPAYSGFKSEARRFFGVAFNGLGGGTIQFDACTPGTETVVGTGTTTLRASTKANKAGVTSRVLIVSDSIIALGGPTVRLRSIFDAFGQLSIVSVGSRQAKAGRIICNVNGVVQEPSVGAIYFQSGFDFVVEAVNIKGGSGQISFGAGSTLPWPQGLPGNPAAAGTLVARVGNAYGDANINYTSFTGTTYTTNQEGRGGWAGVTWASAGPTYKKCTVSGVVTYPNATLHPPAVYTNNGNTLNARETTAGTITFEVVTGSGTLNPGAPLVKVSGIGDANITFSAVANVAANPFWNPALPGLDLNYYLTTYGIAVPDRIAFPCSPNDVFGALTNADAQTSINASLVAYDALIAMVNTYNTGHGTSIKKDMWTTIMPSYSEDSAASSLQTRWRYKLNLHMLITRFMARYAGSEGSGVYIVPRHLSTDAIDNMRYAEPTPINGSTIALISRQNDILHPPMVGAWQDGDGIYCAYNFLA